MKIDQGEILSRKTALAALGVVTAAAAVFGISALTGSRTDVSQGIAYLDSQKNKESAPIQSAVQALRSQELKDQLAQGRIQIFDMFQDYLFLGDSRVLAFAEYGFFPAENVLADLGNTILTIDERVETVRSRQPGNLIISYGVNDIDSNIGSAPGQNGYGAVFEEKIRELLEADPKARIFVNSIIPAKAGQDDQSASLDRVRSLNDEIRSMCQRCGWTYIDNDSLALDGTAEIYEPDGIHFQASFYPLWAEHIYEQMEQAKNTPVQPSEDGQPQTAGNEVTDSD